MAVHRGRRRYAVPSLRRRIDLSHIQHQRGHSDIKTTVIYLVIEDTDRCPENGPRRYKLGFESHKFESCTAH